MLAAPKGTWRIIDDVLNPGKSTKQSNIEHLDISGSIVNDSNLICEPLNNHLSTIEQNLAK